MALPATKVDEDIALRHPLPYGRGSVSAPTFRPSRDRQGAEVFRDIFIEAGFKGRTVWELHCG